MTRKWNISNDQSSPNYAVGNQAICSTEVLKSNLCNYSAAYILVRVEIPIIGRTNATQVIFETRISDTEDLDLVMPMHDF